MNRNEKLSDNDTATATDTATDTTPTATDTPTVTETDTASAARDPAEPIAIVGMSALYPGAHGVEDLWRLLLADGPAPASGTGPAPGGLGDIEVDVARFGIPPAQAASMARLQLLMVEAARQCLDDATGSGADRGRTDVVVGTCLGLDRQYANALRVDGARYARDLTEVLADGAWRDTGIDARAAGQELNDALSRRLGASPHDRVGEMASTIPARIASAFKLRGRTLAVESADATSYLALAHAVDNLRAGLAEAVLVVVGQRDEGRFARRALAAKGFAARPSEAGAGDAPVLTEGLGALLLKRRSTAERDGDRVYASVLDCALRHEARPGIFRYSLSAAHRRAAAEAAHRTADVAPGSVRLVECAGYGTAAVGRAEQEAIAGIHAGAPRDSVAVGTVRDRLGHTFANAGLAGVTKAALALHHRTVPPVLPGTDPAPTTGPFRVPRAAEPWEPSTDGTPRRAAVLGASLTGTVCHVLLEEAAPAGSVPQGAGADAHLGGARAAGAARRRFPGGQASAAGRETGAWEAEPIAIVGFGGRFADSPDADGFWRTMLSGRDRIGPLPAELFDRDLYHAPGALALGRSYTDLGAPVPVPTQPPPGLRIPPHRYAATDAAQRLGLDVAAEMFARYGRDPHALDGVGTVVVGSNLGLSRERRLHTGLCLDDLEADVRSLAALAALGPDDVEAVTKLVRDRFGEAGPDDLPTTWDGCVASGIAALLGNEHGLDAVPVAVEAACASSLAAVDVAVGRLRSGGADYAVAGGVELPCNARDMVLCSSLGLLSHSRITPFDAGADGFTPGDGCALFLLKRLTDARRDGDRVFGVLRAVGASNDAKSLIAPDADGQARAVRQAFAQVDFGPDEVDYLEAHGTGTRLGDRVEVAAAAQVYGTGRRTAPLDIGSAKSFLGHTFAAAGAAGLLRTLQALRQATLPPSVNLHELSPDLALDAVPARVATEAGLWPARAGRPRRAAVSAFGTGGINYHLLIEEGTDATR
ncbi:polyketide synthase [Streptomyces anthocyanicus]|uniref:beta-ketoacyl [acyl carrier protein] synthase domain-containing protein n=1 Tax=Streptomyces anthocyanicus TaxID=68174 RepID=UPI00386D35E3|nr:polyketide synthase [Streptomyces anthocyanicus]